MRRMFMWGAVGCLGLGFSATASAAILADFIPEPGSPNIADIEWTGANFVEGPGSVGTGFGVAGAGDGELATNVQERPGLLVESPLVVNGIPGSEVNLGQNATTFLDATLKLSGLAPSAPAQEISATGVVVQPLGEGQFTLWSTDPDDAPNADQENPIKLLEGTVSTGVISGILGARTGAVLSASVTFTGGAILDAHPASSLSGDLSWSLLDMDRALATDTDSGNLFPFTANIAGQFSGIPEPATLALMATGAVLIMMPRRRNRR